jgi:hypothetical protein
MITGSSPIRGVGFRIRDVLVIMSGPRATTAGPGAEKCGANCPKPALVVVGVS